MFENQSGLGGVLPAKSCHAMSTRRTVLLLTLCLTGSASAQQAVDATAAPDSLIAPPVEKRFGRAALLAAGSNVGIWIFNRYIREGGTNPGFRIGWNSWQENLNNGFEWDDNNFGINQLGHPYHGSMYFTSARANGFSFYESAPFSFMGSIMWEYFGEKHHPSINDWISTSVGGIALGETLHRFSTMVIDNQATGTERIWREIGGLAINPMGSLNRMLDGDFTRVGPNPKDRFPEHLRFLFSTGIRTVGEGKSWTGGVTHPFVRLNWLSGNPWGEEIERPFDSNSFDLQFNFGESSLIGRANVRGVLRSWQLNEGGDSNYFFGIEHDYDYLDTEAFKFGGQSLGPVFLMRTGSEGLQLNAAANLLWIILAGTSSDYESYTGRVYDYGPGTGSKLNFDLRRHGKSLFSIANDLYYLRIMNGTEANHVVMETRIAFGVPIPGPLNLGFDYRVYHAERHYADFEDVSRRTPQMQISVTWVTQ